MDKSDLYEIERPVREFGVEVPAWIESDIHVSTIVAVYEGGCASGSYMPAVTYRTARATMAEHGDAVLQYLEDACGELPAIPDGSSWSGISTHYLASAVDVWCSALVERMLDCDDLSELEE